MLVGGASAVDRAPLAITPDLLLLCSNGRVRFSLQESLDSQHNTNFVAPEYPTDFTLSDEALEKVNTEFILKYVSLSQFLDMFVRHLLEWLQELCEMLLSWSEMSCMYGLYNNFFYLFFSCLFVFCLSAMFYINLL